MVLYAIQAGPHWVVAKMNAQGGCKRFLSQGERRWVEVVPLGNKADDFGAVGSLDGQWIAFFSRRNGALNVWIAKSDGSAAQALSTEESDIIQPGENVKEHLAFSPDSKHLAFVMHGHLWVTSVADRQLRTLTHGQKVSALAWSPNSRWIGFVQGKSVRRIGLSGAPLDLMAGSRAAHGTLSWIGDADKGGLLFFGRGLQRVTMDKKVDLLYSTLLIPNRVQAQPGTVDHALVMAVAPDGLKNEVFYTTFNDKKKTAEQVTHGGAEDALFMPDGKSILFQREGRLWRCGLDGKQAKPLTDASVRDPWTGKLATTECP